MPVVRIRPQHAPLWRSTRELQFGVAGGPVLEDPVPWQERVVSELERGFVASGIASLSADPTQLARFSDAPPDGTAALLRALAPVLEVVVSAAGGVVVRATDPLAADVVSTVVDALTDEGWPATWLAPDVEPVDPTTPTVLLAANAMPPHVGVRCMSDDAPHLPIVFTAAGADVGPFVRPGRTACLACLDAHRTDTDPAWPVLASQLLLRPAPRASLPLAVEAATVAAILLDEAGAGGGVDAETGTGAGAGAGAAAGTTAEARAGVDSAGEAAETPSRAASIAQATGGRGAQRRAITWRLHRRHPRCLCRLDDASTGAPPITVRVA